MVPALFLCLIDKPRDRYGYQHRSEAVESEPDYRQDWSPRPSVRRQPPRRASLSPGPYDDDSPPARKLSSALEPYRNRSPSPRRRVSPPNQRYETRPIQHGLSSPSFRGELRPDVRTNTTSLPEQVPPPPPKLKSKSQYPPGSSAYQYDLGRTGTYALVILAPVVTGS